MDKPLTKQQQQMVADTTYIIEKEVDWFLRGVTYNISEIRDNMRSAGGLALCLAALKWQPGGAPFSTFARYRIRGAIYNEISALAGISRAQWNKYKQLLNAANDIGCEWNDERAAEHIGMNPTRFEGVKSSISCYMPVAIDEIGLDRRDLSVQDEDEQTDDYDVYISKLDGIVHLSGDGIFDYVSSRHFFGYSLEWLNKKQRTTMQVSMHDKVTPAGFRLQQARNRPCFCGSEKIYKDCCGL